MAEVLERLRTCITAFLLIAPIVSLSLSLIPGESIAYEHHGFIEIDGDSEFLYDDSVISGNGTAENPYIISNWRINGSYTYGIHIKNTRACFAIKGLAIENSSFAAIRFDNVSNGRIEDSIFLYNRGSGIYLMGTRNITVANCRLYSTGSTAILIGDSEGVNIDNVLARDMGKAVYAEHSSSINMADCVFENATSAIISMSHVRNSKIQDSILRNSVFKGLELISVNDTEFAGNAIVNASTGIYLYDSHMLYFHGNMICLSRAAQVQATLSSSIKWNATYAQGGGNYWSDYFGPDLYKGAAQDIPGSDGIIDQAFVILLGNVDSYPLLRPTLPDTLPPLSVAYVLGEKRAGSWYKSFAIVVINSTDDFSGVLNVTYSIDSEPYVEYKGSFMVSNSGEHIIRFRAADRMLNCEIEKTIVVRVDSSPPVTEIVLDGIEGQGDWYLSPVTVIINATDNESGVASIWYSIDAGSTAQYSSFFTLSDEGYHNLVAYSIDLVGNTGAIDLVQTSIDLTYPELSINEVNGTLFTSLPVRITWAASDAVSGLDHFEVSVDGESLIRLPPARKQYEMSSLSDGDHVLTVIAFDKAGHLIQKEISFKVQAGIAGILISNMATIISLIVLIAVIIFAVIVRNRRKRRR